MMGKEKRRWTNTGAFQPRASEFAEKSLKFSFPRASTTGQEDDERSDEDDERSDED